MTDLDYGRFEALTFDCYGTLIDWNGGIAGRLGRLFGRAARERLLARYHQLEPETQAEQPTLSYRDVMALALTRPAADEGVDLAPGESEALGRSLPDWPVFPEVPAALGEARSRGFRLGIPCIWVNRLGEATGAYRPTREIPDLGLLPDVLDELAPS